MNLFDHHLSSSSSYQSKLTSFEPSEFQSETFSVDEFIQRKRYTVPLDVLRDDLGSHLKYLRSSLIELINQDYGQFVSLSSNLYGLDGKIQNITGPLSRAQAELKALDDTLAETLKNLTEEQNHRKYLRSTRVQLQLLRRIHKLIESSEKYLKGNEADDFKILKLTCDKVAEIKYLISKSASSPLRRDLEWRYDKCRSILLSKLAVSLRTSALNTETENEDVKSRTSAIKSILQMYSQLSSESLAESVFTIDILKPRCDSVLSSKGNINSLFSEVEKVLQNSLLLQVAKEDSSIVSKYDFVTNCILSHVVATLIKQFPHIWYTSVPDSFHSNWRRCEAFIVTLEENLPSSEHLDSFRNSEVLRNFISKWQFNVYFQLRFHTLAVELETSLDTLQAPCANDDFRLDSTRVLMRVLNQCWDSEKIFIVQLSGRFLKASALFISRYLQEISATTPRSNNLLELIQSHCDILLLELVILQFLQPKILECVQEEDSNSINFVKDFPWDETNQLIESRITEITVGQSIIPISTVTEVPRLFRRTNRETPTKPSEFVNAILEPIRSLHNTIRETKGGEDLFDRIGEKICQTVANRFIVQVEEVLVSVQRMEESLKRLKKVKGGRNIGNTTEHTNNSIVEKSSVLSDDDKIRLQIKLDLEYFASELKILCPVVSVDTKNISNLQLLEKKL